MAAVWRQPVLRFAISLVILYLLARPWWWAVQGWGRIPGWPAWIGAALSVVLAALVSTAAAAAHHLGPSYYRGIAIGRTVAYTLAGLPLALLVGIWLARGIWAHAVGLLLVIVLTSGLVYHLYHGPELRQ